MKLFLAHKKDYSFLLAKYIINWKGETFLENSHRHARCIMEERWKNDFI